MTAIAMRSHILPMLRSISSIRHYTTITPLTNLTTTTTTTTTTRTTPHPKAINELQHTEQTILDLLSTISIFPNKNQLHSQVRTLTNRLKSPNLTPIRIGIIGGKPSLLNSLLIDIYDDSKEGKLWYDGVCERDLNGNNLISYARTKDKIKIDRERGSFVVPSPILKDLKVEFIEINNYDEIDLATSSCSLVLDFDGSSLISDGRFPVYFFKDLQNSQVLGYSEIDSARYEKIIKLLKESPSLNSTIYSKEYPLTNISQFREILSKIIATADDKLYDAIIKNLENQLSTSVLSLRQLEQQTDHLNRLISAYSEYLNLTFQRQFKPSFHDFQFKTLAWWKLYTSINQIPTRFKDFLEGDKFLNDSIKQYSYIQGQISTSSSSSSSSSEFKNEQIIKDNPLIALKSEILTTDIPSLCKHGHELLYTNFINFQLPLIALSNFGVILFDFSTFSMASVALLGLTIGFNNISRDWVKYVHNWEIGVLERFRGRIINVERELQKKVENWNESERISVEKREKCLQKFA